MTPVPSDIRTTRSLSETPSSKDAPLRWKTKAPNIAKEGAELKCAAPRSALPYLHTRRPLI